MQNSGIQGDMNTFFNKRTRNKTKKKKKRKKKTEKEKKIQQSVYVGAHLAPTARAWAARRSVQPSSGHSGHFFTNLNILYLSV